MKKSRHVLFWSVPFVLACFPGCDPRDKLRDFNPFITEVPTLEADARSEIESSSVVTVTPLALAKFREFLGASPSSYVRVHVMSGDCNGFAYKLKIEDKPIDPTDRIDRSNGITLVMSPNFAIILQGTTIDWETQTDGTEGFKFHNPIDRE